MTTSMPNCLKWSQMEAVGPELSAFLDWLSGEGIALMHYTEFAGVPCPHRDLTRVQLLTAGLVGHDAAPACPGCGAILARRGSQHVWIEEPYSGHFVIQESQKRLVERFLGIDSAAREREIRALLSSVTEGAKP